MVYWRLSAQVYLELSDFERLGKAVLNRTTHAEFRRLDALTGDNGEHLPRDGEAKTWGRDKRVSHARKL